MSLLRITAHAATQYVDRVDRSIDPSRAYDVLHRLVAKARWRPVGDRGRLSATVEVRGLRVRLCAFDGELTTVLVPDAGLPVDTPADKTRKAGITGAARGGGASRLSE